MYHYSKKLFYLLTVNFSALFFIGCAQPQNADDLMPSTKSSCTGQIIKETYIVKYKSGEFKSYKYSDREKFKKEIVEPQLTQIAYIEFDQKFELQPRELGVFSPQMIDNWGLQKVGAESAWQSGHFGQGVTVAVVDSGVDVNHNLLRNQIAYNLAESGFDSRGFDKRSNGIDDDNNGYIDDYAGFDFVNQSGQMVDTVSHGTHVAGIIAAEHSSSVVISTSVQGLAPKAKILPVRFLGNQGGTLDGALRSLDYAKKRGVQVINASWGGDACSQALQDKVREVTDAGIIFVAAAGNNGSNLDFSPEFPAAFRFGLQITVGSSGTRDGMSSFSNFSRTFVDLFAPGFNIFSTLPNNSIGAESGTSMAAPFVSAAVAVLMSARPSASPIEIIEALYSSVDTNPEYLNKTSGRLNVSRAIDKIIK